MLKGKKQSKKIIYILLSLFLLSIFSLNRNIMNVSSASTQMYCDAWEINFDFNHKKGNDFINWDIQSLLKPTYPTHFTDECYSIDLPQITNASSFYNLDGETSTFTISFENREPQNSIAYSSTDIMHGKSKNIYQGYLMNTTDTMLWSRDASTIYLNGVSIDGSSKWFLASLVGGLTCELKYHFEPIIIINSSFYDFENTKIFINDKVSDNWIQQSFDSIVLNHPQYKLRIYDKNTNKLIFEDLEYQTFTIYRSIDIESFKIQNNDDETILFNANSNLNYKAQYGFNDDIVNSQPNYFSYDSDGSFTHVEDNKDYHNKILYSNDAFSLNISEFEYNQSSIEWWQWQNDSMQIKMQGNNNFSLDVMNENDNEYISIFDNDLNNWINIDDDDTYSTYLQNKTLSNGIKYNVLQQWDNSTTGNAYIYQNIDSGDFTVYSFWMACSTTISYFRFYNGGTSLFMIRGTSVDSQVYATGGTNLYMGGHYYEWNLITLVVYETGTYNVDCYRNGIFIGNIEYSANLPITKIDINTATSLSGFYAWYSDLYFGNSIDEALCSNSSRITVKLNNEISDFIYINSDFVFRSWQHYQIKYDVNSISFYQNQTLLYSYSRFPLIFNSISWCAFNTSEFWIDAIDTNIKNNEYTEHQNLEINESVNWDCNLYPDWESGYFGIDELNLIPDLTFGTYSLLDSYESHNNVHNLDTTGSFFVFNSIPQFESGSVEFWFRTDTISEIQYFPIIKNELNQIILAIQTTSSQFRIYNGASHVIMGANSNQWYHFRIDLESGNGNYLGMDADTFNLWIDKKYWGNFAYWNNADYINDFTYTINGGTTKNYVDGFTISTLIDDYFPFCSTLENTTYLMLDSLYNISMQINPYSYSISNCSQIYQYQITDIYSNQLEQGTISYNSEYAYIPVENRDCFISIRDQSSNYLNWENYHLYLNNSALYSNTFSRELGSTWNISVYDQFNYMLISEIYTVQRSSNFIDLTLTLYSLKIFNQQGVFNYINITRDPNYYDTTDSWSEWIAPNEIINFKLMSGYYRLNVSYNEESSYILYSYTLNADDILLMTSDNTIANAIYNIINTNTTIGNQITEVNISISNTQSIIENQTLLIDVNIGNMNSTIGNLLIDMESQINNLGNNITTLFADMDNSLLLINGTIYNAMLGMESTLITQGNTILGNLTYIIQNNPELTAIYTNTYFSQFIDWSNDTTYIRSQTTDYTFLNNYNNQSLVLELQYQDQIRELQLASQSMINQAILNHDVNYRIKSVATDEYLTEWKPLNETVMDFGFYESEFNPDLINTEMNDWLLLVIIVGSIAVAGIFIIIGMRNKYTPKQPKRSTHNKDQLKLVF